MGPARFELLIMADREPVGEYIFLNHFPLKAHFSVAHA